MANTESLKDEFRKDLQKLQFLVGYQREHEAGPNVGYQDMNRFLIAWCDRFMDEEQQGADVGQVGFLRDQLFTAIRDIELGREPQILRGNESERNVELER